MEHTDVEYIPGDGTADVDIADVPREHRATAPEDDNPAASAGGIITPGEVNGWGADDQPAGNVAELDVYPPTDAPEVHADPVETGE